MSENFDLLVIGTGTAGLSAAHATAAAGWKVGIVDALPYGGTCALRGCDPKKILRRGAEVVESAALMRDRGIVDDGLRIDWSALQRHKRGFTDAMSRQVEAGLEDGGVTTLHGTARFVGRDAVDIDGEVHRAERFLIASGAAPKPLDLPGSEHVIDSTAFLGLETLPERIVFIGGGFISFEFAHIAARAGARCTILSRSERPLRGFDPDLVDRLVERTRSAGIDVRLSTTPASVRQTRSGAFDIRLAGMGMMRWKRTWSCTEPVAPPRSTGSSSTRRRSRTTTAASRCIRTCRAPRTPQCGPRATRRRPAGVR